MTKGQNSIRIAAAAAHGQTGHFVARITGRNSKFTFEREFVGSARGKRGELKSALLDEPGLYQSRDVDRKGCKDDTYHLIWRDGEDLRELIVSDKDALRIAREIEGGGDPSVIGRREVIAVHRARLDETGEKDQEAVVKVPYTLEHVFSAPEQPLREIRAARLAEIARLGGATDEVAARTAALEVDASRAALLAERDRLVARIAEIDAALNAVVEIGNTDHA